MTMRSKLRPQSTIKVIGVGIVAMCAFGASAVVASNSGAHTLPPAKQAFLDREAQVRAQAAASNAAAGIAKSNAPAPSAAPPGSQMALDPESQAGDGILIQSSVPPAGEQDTIVKNRWYLSLGSAGILVVYAGCDATVQSEGVVLVSRGSGAPIDRFVAPGGHGCLAIVGASARTLQLAAADGFTIQFDVRTSAFT